MLQASDLQRQLEKLAAKQREEEAGHLVRVLQGSFEGVLMLRDVLFKLP